MQSKGFVITTDAFIALTLLFILAVVSFFFISNTSIESWNNVDLVLASRDESALLEKSLALENAVLRDSTEPITELINASPQAICLEVSVFSQSDLNTPVMYALKASCTKSFSEVVVSQRSFVVNNGSSVNFFVARIGAWYK
jgi:hypothetical protein